MMQRQVDLNRKNPFSTKTKLYHQKVSRKLNGYGLATIMCISLQTTRVWIIFQHKNQVGKLRVLCTNIKTLVDIPCRRIFGFFISDNGNDTRLKMSVSLIAFLEGAKEGINFVSMIQK